MAERAPSAVAVRQAVKAALACVPKGRVVASYKVRLVDGSPEVDVTLATDSVQVGPIGGPLDAETLAKRIRDRAARRS